MKKITTENHVKAIVKEWFERLAAWSYAPIQNGMGVHGIPDRIGCVPVTITPEMVGSRVGVFVAVECKKPGRRGEADRGMSKHQYLTGVDIRTAGGRVIVCDGIEDLIELDKLLPGSTKTT